MMLRDEVQALADECERDNLQLVRWYAPDQCYSRNAAMVLRALLDAEAPDEGEGEVLAQVKRAIRDLGDMACIGCRANTCPACGLAAEVTAQVHVLATRPSAPVG